MAGEKQRPKRKYQVWKGSNRFLCGGRLIFGPDVASLFFSTLLVAGPAVSFCIKIYSIIKHHESNGIYSGYWYGILILAAIITCLDITFLFMTSSRDPGIVPRNSLPSNSDETYDMNTPSMEWDNGRTPHLRLPRTKEVFVNGHSVKVKYCDTCMLYRPPRASHCSVCNNCVQRFDHHCPWVGQCIGIRNYRCFYLFISTSTILCIYVFAFSWINIVQHEGTIWMAITQDVLSDFLIVYCFIAVWFVGGLTIFHFYLICSNQTTYENFRYRYDKKENPYHKGVKKNFLEVFLSKIPPSLNDFRALVNEDERIMMDPTSRNHEDAASKAKIDIEVGNKYAEASGRSLPEILQNLHYEDLEDNTKSKEGNGGSNYVMSPFVFETNKDGTNGEKKCNEEIIAPETQNVRQE